MIDCRIGHHDDSISPAGRSCRSISQPAAAAVIVSALRACVARWAWLASAASSRSSLTTPRRSLRSGPGKLPRFASLRSDEVNLRVGPGENYPIEWVLKRKDMPVEILREFAAGVREMEPQARLWAFGSRARGEAAPDSDLDICVVLPAVTPELRRRIRLLAWQIGFDEERLVATVIVPENEFEHGPLSATSLVRNIHTEGVAA